VIKLNEAFAPSNISALILNKARLVCLYRQSMVILLYFLSQNRINADVGVHWWNWTAIYGPVLARPGLADHHLVSCPLLADVQPDINGFGDAVHQMRHIRVFFIERGRSAATATLSNWLKLVGTGSGSTADPMDPITCLTRASTLASSRSSNFSSISFSRLSYFASCCALALERLR
jgi:hypothetical protein